MSHFRGSDTDTSVTVWSKSEADTAPTSKCFSLSRSSRPRSVLHSTNISSDIQMGLGMHTRVRRCCSAPERSSNVQAERSL